MNSLDVRSNCDMSQLCQGEILSTLQMGVVQLCTILHPKLPPSAAGKNTTSWTWSVDLPKLGAMPSRASTLMRSLGRGETSLSGLAVQGTYLPQKLKPQN